MKVLKGKVVSGIGQFSSWIDRLQNYYYNKTNMRFFPGILNIELENI
jgi:riboflavin kinase, archaea type